MEKLEMVIKRDKPVNASQASQKPTVYYNWIYTLLFNTRYKVTRANHLLRHESVGLPNQNKIYINSV
ncbi:hypothetical protein DPMN_148750 [Dreissena polymorpha]|uniref:Uncharacterized protein n=1 Tax=Dreissena polymorpha TaxID=45954 RepID=A0A9D4J4N6_DREPO|nr:hypothetical protein DPMN_148750 [Dreissena polymorpha]